MSKWAKSALFIFLGLAAGVVLFRAGHTYATAHRGYEAIGGEIFLLGFPFILYTVLEAARDFIETWKEVWDKPRGGRARLI